VRLVGVERVFFLGGGGGGGMGREQEFCDHDLRVL